MKKAAAVSVAGQTAFPILFAISFSHLLNDTIQSLIPSIYPIIKDSFHLSFGQVGLITLTFQITASLLQPFVGLFTDKRPMPYSLATGMGFTLIGLLSLSVASQFSTLLLSVALVGIGSAIFHPEASRVAFLASGGKRGMAQSLFQVGGNAGSALGPLLAAMIIVKHGQSSVSWFSVVALLAIGVLWVLGNWYKQNRVIATRKDGGQEQTSGFTKSRVIFSIGILLVLVFSKYFYMASMSSYYTFYLMDKFHVSVQDSQLYLFLFLFSVAVGTFIGGPVGDRIGRRYVIWVSILGAAPFTLLLPHVNLFWTAVLTVIIGLTLSSAFSAILVYAQELVPGKVGMIAGLFFGFSFGMGGIGSAVLGRLADATSLEYVYQVCSFLPLLGLLTVFLPNTKKA
ncbi:MFS transporter [Siphonobacter aquaeclarae]|uniref:MFS transporter, FSR family, fosmidomycin resistance protein n=1 Tax=Siphonobacter aquaeclarae TaxID=563176 RepID=A0A1G9IB32_9BACT|nr:MFS transporter [Siphonobacter aquaeclarae]SDL22322.1 MFS transporter, FSR family, fosmidomycin resistance protein [Siphonobacter aquaeclarae]